jgi:hypothetical protein
MTDAALWIGVVLGATTHLEVGISALVVSQRQD